MKYSQLFKNFIIMILLYVVDSTLTYYLPYNLDKSGITFVPSLGLMMFILLCKTLTDRSERFFFAAVCGLYYSICYANSLLIYILIYAFVAFVRTYLIYEPDLPLINFILFVIAVITLKEFSVYFMLSSIGYTNLSLMTFIKWRYLPTLIVNTLASPLVYLLYQWFDFKIETNDFKKVDVI